ALRSFFQDKKEENIISFCTTHGFDKDTKILKKETIKSTFTLIQERYIKSSIENINDFIIQELPHDAIIHFLDSDDYFLNNCIELCIKPMLEKDLDICTHDLKEYHEENKEFIKKDFFEKTGDKKFYKPLDLLKLNKKYNFYFAWQGIFKARVLNLYKLRFTHGIYHEDHDFGTILFALADKMFHIKKALIVYRIREGSITHFNDDMPDVLPKHLQALKKYFNHYKELRDYFKLYCDIVIAKRIQIFNKNTNDRFLKKSIKRYYIHYFDMKIDKDPFNLNKEIQFFIKNLKYYNIYVKLRHYIRHPKKIIGL
ncbi:glycosyl transferase family A, partial [Campylobacter sp. VicNov18]